ncbi:histidine triad nucleotide-binding protein [Archangium violaceum]|uniref:histidine triad nucleotide-binding protein n=1 Tax=Archangium TaxID=47 RepID=UPI000937502D|nr:histidine triad nucleotide-binding protein [Archangium sp. Cb G35]OJT19711.1 histidine triad nucleotide-binding protein [Archangium sp. Cb G35]WPB78567.1 histidine triad nucleotide-binding protein [Archangium gephyra]
MSDCIFCKIRDGHIPARLVHRDDHCLAIEDINPQAPTHLLIIPLEHIPTMNDVTVEHREMVGHLHLTAAKLARQRGLADSGYRLVFNTRRDAGQTVFHIHLHLLGGRPMEWPPG